MLEALGKALGDYFLPDPFYNGITFEGSRDDDASPTLPESAETLLALDLKIQMREYSDSLIISAETEEQEANEPEQD
jgi:hypothetical protein